MQCASMARKCQALSWRSTPAMHRSAAQSHLYMGDMAFFEASLGLPSPMATVYLPIFSAMEQALPKAPPAVLDGHVPWSSARNVREIPLLTQDVRRMSVKVGRCTMGNVCYAVAVA